VLGVCILGHRNGRGCVDETESDGMLWVSGLVAGPRAMFWRVEGRKVKCVYS